MSMCYIFTRGDLTWHLGICSNTSVSVSWIKDQSFRIIGAILEKDEFFKGKCNIWNWTLFGAVTLIDLCHLKHLINNVCVIYHEGRWCILLQESTRNLVLEAQHNHFVYVSLQYISNQIHYFSQNSFHHLFLFHHLFIII